MWFMESHFQVNASNVLPVSVNGIMNMSDDGLGIRGSTVVKVLCYKSEGRWFDSRWFH